MGVRCKSGTKSSYVHFEFFITKYTVPRLISMNMGRVYSLQMVNLLLTHSGYRTFIKAIFRAVDGLGLSIMTSTHLLVFQ